MQQSEYTIDNIKCKVLFEQIKNSYIQIRDGQVIVKVPVKTNESDIYKLVSNKKDWILKNLQKVRRKNSYVDGGIVYILGKKYIIKVFPKKSKNSIYINGNYLCCELSNDAMLHKQYSIENLVEKFYKNIAKEEVTAAMEHIKIITNLAPKQVHIKKLKATWGICSSKKEISINQNLMAYSRHAIEYVCLHEVCHLKHMNHSKEFWNMIEHYMPNYKLAKLELKN